MERLQEAAITLFQERGYADVTIADIAERAGLTKRSFFNHFPDKREVLFAGAAELEAEVRRHLDEATDEDAPMDLAIAALTLAGADLSRYGEFTTIRRDIIASATELQERSLIKLSMLSSVVQSGLRARGVDPGTAAFVSDAAVTIFNVAYDSWGEHPSADFATLMQRYLTEFRAATAAPSTERAADRLGRS
jgi:AcrR family transcriptional regulator